MRKRKQPAADIQHLYFDERKPYALIYVKHELNIYVFSTWILYVRHVLYASKLNSNKHMSTPNQNRLHSFVIRGMFLLLL